MAQITHTGNGDVSNTNNLGYSFTFPSLSAAEIQVSVNNVGKTITTDYTIQNFSQSGSSNSYVLFTSTTARGTGTVRIFRQTDGNNLEHTFQSGSAIKADDLNTSNQQVLYLAEEAREAVNNLALGSSGSAVQINGSNIANNSITSDKILDLEVKTSDINNLAVTTGKVADDAITTDKLANSINTTLTSVAGKANTGANLSTFTNDTNYITLAQVPTSFVTGMILMYTGTTAPTGWALCDGTNGTPNLRDKFIVGSGSTYSNGDTGGQADAIVPDHTHTTSIDGGHVIPGNGGTSYPYGGAGTYASTIFSMNNPTNGESVTNKNLPPYYALCFIVKT